MSGAVESGGAVKGRCASHASGGFGVGAGRVDAPAEGGHMACILRAPPVHTRVHTPRYALGALGQEG